MTTKFTGSGGAAYSSQKDDWETPTRLFKSLDNEFNFTLDAAADRYNRKCRRFYSSDDSAFDHSWRGETVFCNPPYGRKLGKWVKKCSTESANDNTTVVMLIPARTDTKWFHDYILGKSEIRLIKGRIYFEVSGIEIGRAPFPSMIVVMRKGIRPSVTGYSITSGGEMERCDK